MVKIKIVTTPNAGNNLKSFKGKWWGFPGRPVGKTPCSQCRGPGFDLWSGK